MSRQQQGMPEVEPVPDRLLERLLVGELPPAEARRVQERLAAEPGGPERLARLQAEGQALLAARPPAVFAAEVARRLAVVQAEERMAATLARARWGRRLLLAAPAGAVALVVVLLVALPRAPDPAFSGSSGARQALVHDPATDRDPEPEITRSKGLESSLRLHRREGTSDVELAAGAPVRSGDLLQLGYVATAGSYGTIFSIDGRGSVTLHLPEAAGPAPPLQPGREVALPHAYELDDAPDFERFFLVSGARPFELAPVIAAARTLARDPRLARSGQLELPAGFAQRSLLLVKVAASGGAR